MITAQSVLESTFGYPCFRHRQEDIINTVVAGGDALVLMPTGGGKSLCYQIPALVRDGCGIVVSPLIALMQDQVDALRQLGVKASYLNSTLSAEDAYNTEQALLAGQLDLLYVAPERLKQQRMLDLLNRAPIALFAIDEAHCVSQWGHDFRADYLVTTFRGGELPNPHKGTIDNCIKLHLLPSFLPFIQKSQQNLYLTHSAILVQAKLALG